MCETQVPRYSEEFKEDVNAMSLAIIEALNEETHPDVALRAGDFNVDNAVSGYLALIFPDSLK